MPYGVMGPWRRRPRQKEDPRCSARSHNGAELHQAAAVGHALDIVVTKVRQDEGLHDLGDEGEEGGMYGRRVECAARMVMTDGVVVVVDDDEAWEGMRGYGVQRDES